MMAVHAAQYNPAMNRRGFVASIAALALPASASLTSVLEGRAFAGAMSTPKVAGLYGIGQLWNPPGSGKLCIVCGLVCDTPDEAAPFGAELIAWTSPLANLVGHPKNRILGDADSVMELRTGTMDTYPVGPLYGFPHLSARMKAESFPFMVAIPPGRGILFAPEVVNVQVCITWSHTEQ